MLVAVMVTVVAVVFVLVMLKTLSVISAEDSCADEIRTRDLTVYCSWLLGTGECEGGGV